MPSTAAFVAIMIAQEQFDLMRRRFIYKSIKQKHQNGGNVSMPLPEMIKGLIGKSVKLDTINASFKGVITQIQDDWVQLKFVTGKKERELFIRCDMIINIQTV